MKQSSVSVIIPCFNVEKYLEKCLNSVINQTQKNIEIICIDDASKDNTKKILEQYKHKDSRIKIVLRKHNGGLSCARNDGISIASGEYILFIDSDDYIDENMIKDMYEKAKKRDVDIVRCNRYDVYPKQNKKIEREPIFKTETYIEKKDFKQYIYTSMLKRNKLYPGIWMSMCKTSIIKENNLKFQEKLIVDEDQVFAIELFTIANSFLYIPKPYCFYVKHGEGLSAKGVDLKKRFESRKNHVKWIKQYEKKWELNDEDMLNEKIAFIGVSTAFQTTRLNKNFKFKTKYTIYKDIIKDKEFSYSINRTKYIDMLLPEKILSILIKRKLYFLGYIWGLSANLAIDILRPYLENKKRK